MKIAVAFYYKNIEQYPREWIFKCIDSYFIQTFQEFDVYELQYGRGGYSLQQYSLDLKSNLLKCGKEHHYNSICCDNHAEAMNFIYEWIFETHDVVVNTNVDDFYAPNRIELLLQEIDKGYDIVSSNYHVISQDEKIIWSTDFANVDIYAELKRWNNVISNPGHALTKKVFDKIQFDPKLIPIEDLSYWMKAAELGFKFSIRPEYLHFYRQHKGQTTLRKKNEI